ncbi:YcjF family protein [Nitrincola sp.]|uniref:YcjF family protein n=1 Tax=Nitrincola sp. TaxID=1926584 RepID=UPI003A8E1114
MNSESRINNPLPTLWLLGKTGAGKSSLIRFLTGNPAVALGAGFRPCTQTADAFDFPSDAALLRFLDTRGLGESSYDPTEDIHACMSQSHALLVCMRVDDPEQSDLVKALKIIKKSNYIKSIILIHTATSQIADQRERQAAQAFNQQQAEKAWGESLPTVAMELADPYNPTGGEALLHCLLEHLPEIARCSQRARLVAAEQQAFKQHKQKLRHYASAAAATDTLPIVGLVSVPALQAALLRSLAKKYAIDWDRRAISSFIATLGTGFGIQYASHLGLRQLVKLIPVYGQTVGSLGAAAVSFATTYAIGRIACKYLYYQSQGESLSETEIQQLYRQAFESIREVAGRETSTK